jgi:hypothetical protein
MFSKYLHLEEEFTCHEWKNAIQSGNYLSTISIEGIMSMEMFKKHIKNMKMGDACIVIVIALCTIPNYCKTLKTYCIFLPKKHKTFFENIKYYLHKHLD